MQIIRVADFSKYPAGRYRTDGPFSGQHFREEWLEPSLRQGFVLVELDGTCGYSSSFLEEAFGGLVRSGYRSCDLMALLTVRSKAHPELEREVQSYIIGASPELTHLSNSSDMNDGNSNKTIRCTDCAAEFTDQETVSAKGCPTCGSTSIPCAIADDVTVRINWHELRILTMWASNYATKQFAGQPGERTLKSVIRRLHAQHPERAPLTLEGEFQEVANAFGDIEVIGVTPEGRIRYKQEKPS